MGGKEAGQENQWKRGQGSISMLPFEARESLSFAIGEYICANLAFCLIIFHRCCTTLLINLEYTPCTVAK